MTIDEAIEKLDFVVSHGMPIARDDYKDAVRLGIESLKRLKEYRARNVVSEFNRLPGETEE